MLSLRWIRLAFGLVVALGGSCPSGAAEGDLRASSAAVREQIEGVIDGQLAALRAGDMSKAYACNGASLRAELSQKGFARMVEKNYPEIWNNLSASYGLIRDNGARAELLVHVYARHGDAPFDYFLRFEDHAWRIVGVLRHDPAASDRV